MITSRNCDYYLGGKDNYAADRAATEAWLKVDPGMAFAVWANQAFLLRAVRYLAQDVGIRQFLNIGTGIPTAGNTHQVAQVVAPQSRVAYVDYGPVVLAHARALLDSHESGATEYIDIDLHDTGKILDQASQILDFTEPVAVTLLAIPPGSHLTVSHVGSDLPHRPTQEEMTGIANRMSQQQYTPRSRERVAT